MDKVGRDFSLCFATAFIIKDASKNINDWINICVFGQCLQFPDLKTEETASRCVGQGYDRIYP